MQSMILETIKSIERNKQVRRVVPSYACYFEICRLLHISKNALLQELEKMQTAGVALRVGNTINDNYILLQPLKSYCNSPYDTQNEHYISAS